MRWKRKLGSRLSPEIDAILRPSSEKKAIDDWFNYYCWISKYTNAQCTILWKIVYRDALRCLTVSLSVPAFLIPVLVILFVCPSRRRPIGRASDHSRRFDDWSVVALRGGGGGGELDSGAVQPACIAYQHNTARHIEQIRPSSDQFTSVGCDSLIRRLLVALSWRLSDSQTSR